MAQRQYPLEFTGFEHNNIVVHMMPNLNPKTGYSHQASTVPAGATSSVTSMATAAESGYLRPC